MSERDILYELYSCSKMGTKVKIIRKVSLHRNSATDEIDARVPTSIDCDHKSKCGVGESSGSNMGYNFKECAHPDIKQ